MTIYFSFTTALDSTIPSKEDSLEITNMIMNSQNAMRQFRTRQQNMQQEETDHFIYNENLNQRLQILTMSEIIVIVVAFLVEILVLNRYLKSSDIL